eukprot:TRINITY_DN63568_c0_g1_i1.p2 TRINITY_DN63568_c0_g1~~TRINITY_DN63568_c0_g1_i1.p2  ORF type:complete len:267 (-),score=50.69 TRINITY_DN63568_c0_g1_i1:122-898(-)
MRKDHFIEKKKHKVQNDKFRKKLKKFVAEKAQQQRKKTEGKLHKKRLKLKKKRRKIDSGAVGHENDEQLPRRMREAMGMMRQPPPVPEPKKRKRDKFSGLHRGGNTQILTAGDIGVGHSVTKKRKLGFQSTSDGKLDVAVEEDARDRAAAKGKKSFNEIKDTVAFGEVAAAPPQFDVVPSRNPTLLAGLKLHKNQKPGDSVKGVLGNKKQSDFQHMRSQVIASYQQYKKTRKEKERNALHGQEKDVEEHLQWKFGTDI